MNNITTDPLESANHEAFHFWKHELARSAYVDVIGDNINFASESAIQFLNKIEQCYIGEAVEIDGDHSAKVLEEAMAYLTGFISSGVNQDIAREILRDYDAVKAAWDTLVESKAPTQKQDGKFSREVSDKSAFTPAEIQAIQGIGRISINQFTEADIQATEKFARVYWQEMGTKSPFFRAWFGDWRANDQTAVQVATQKGDTRGIQKNEDTGWNIQVSGKVFNETNRHTKSYNVAAKPYLPYINSIVKNAVLLDSFGIDPNKPKSNNSLLMHSLYAVADFGNGPELLKLYVEEMNDPNKENTSKRAYQLQNVEKYQLQNGSSQKNASSISSVTGNIRTVADLYATVKQYDKDFTPAHEVNPVLLNEDGTPKVFYHGTYAEFTEFRAEELSPVEGSYFFAENREDAEAYGNEKYGGRVMEVYLTGKSLADYDNQPSEFYKLKNKREQVRWLKARDYDGWYSDMDSGGWGEVSVFTPSQIKSATDNIGTFDVSNPDIRYSREYSYEHLTQKPDMTVTTVSEDVPNNRADVVYYAKQNAAKIGKFNPKDGSVSVHVDDIGVDVVLATNGLKHSLDRRLGVNAPVVVNAGEIIQNSIRINEMTAQKTDAQSSYILIGAAKNSDNDLYIVRSVVNRFNNELTSMDVLYAINAKKELAALNAPRLGAMPLSETNSTISIANLLDYVNEYFPEVLPEVKTPLKSEPLWGGHQWCFVINPVFKRLFKVAIFILPFGLHFKKR